MESFSYKDSNYKYFTEMGGFRLFPNHVPLFDLIDFINANIELKNKESGSNYE